MESPQREFHLEEYRQIREEVTAMITKTELLIQHAAVVSAAVFAWLATQLTITNESSPLCQDPARFQQLAPMVWWVPTAVVLIVGLLGAARFFRVKEMGEYLGLIEKALGHESLGWEKFLDKKPVTVAVVTVMAWLALLIGTVTVALAV